MKPVLKIAGLAAAAFVLAGTLACRSQAEPQNVQPATQTTTTQSNASTVQIILAGLGRHNFSNILLLRQETQPVRHNETITPPAAPQSSAQQNG